MTRRLSRHCRCTTAWSRAGWGLAAVGWQRGGVLFHFPNFPTLAVRIEVHAESVLGLFTPQDTMYIRVREREREGEATMQMALT